MTEIPKLCILLDRFRALQSRLAIMYVHSLWLCHILYQQHSSSCLRILLWALRNIPSNFMYVKHITEYYFH
jgi:hypothetical protein